MFFCQIPRRAGSCAVMLTVMLTGCASIPASGPTAHEVLRGVRPERNAIGMQVVDIDAGVIAQEAAVDVSVQAGTSKLASLARPGRNDIVGPGDQLDISVFEVGASLFGAPRVTADGYDPSAQAQRFPAVVVDRDGNIKLPYAGKLHVVGHTPGEINDLVENAYHGKSQVPQVLVAVHSNISDTVYVTGDVRRPGRVELSLQEERLLDAIGIAGGTVAQTQDMVVRITRNGQQMEQRLDRVGAASADNIVLVPGDRIELIRQPQTYVMLGAANKPSQVSFDQTNLTLAEAVGRAGGPNDAAANPRAVFLFRYDPIPGTDSAQDGAAAKQRPVIYRLDLMEPSNYFLAQRFAMRDKDVLYVSNARMNRVAKFAAIINSLFSPFVAARSVSN